MTYKRIVYVRRVYVIELDNPMTVYVGETGLPVEERFEKHRIGYKSSRHVKRAKHPILRPDLYEHLPTYNTVKESRTAESRLAKLLQKKGFTVYGGH